MKRNIIRKNTGLNGISIERQIEIPDYDMTLLKLSTMTPYLEGRRYVYGRGDGNVTPTPIENITITRNGKEITLVPPASFGDINYTSYRLTVTDTENNIYAISKLGNNPAGNGLSYNFYIIRDDASDGFMWGVPPGTVPDDSIIYVIDAFKKSPEVLQPELVSWLEAQGFTIPIE